MAYRRRHFERPPANFLSPEMTEELADTLEVIGDGTTRAVVLRADGKHFSAGVDFTVRGRKRTGPSSKMR
jgi:enoyl-CoA hydratase/carnithine racemase